MKALLTPVYLNSASQNKILKIRVSQNVDIWQVDRGGNEDDHQRTNQGNLFLKLSNHRQRLGTELPNQEIGTNTVN